MFTIITEFQYMHANTATTTVRKNDDKHILSTLFCLLACLFIFVCWSFLCSYISYITKIKIIAIKPEKNVHVVCRGVPRRLSLGNSYVIITKQ